MDVPQALRVERPHWLNARTVLGLLLFLAAFAGGQRVIASSQETVGVWVAARDLPADIVIGPDDVRLSFVSLPAELRSGYLTQDTTIAGSVVNRPVFAGELMSATSVRAGGSSPIDGRSMTIPVSSEHAVGGSLRPGERVDVYVTFDAGQNSARTELLLSSAEVLDVVTDGDLAFGDSAFVGLTVAVTADEAPDVAFAIRNGELDLVRVSGTSDGDQASE